jgi:DNA topoisomerase-1
MRLRRSVVSGPGLRRVRRGRGFSYHDPEGKALADEAALTRIKDLVIPPAWKKVWISPYDNGHIQAIGTDAAGRRQYIYHEKWQEDRSEEKFDRVLEMSKALPDLRRQIASDLRRRRLERDRVLALALHLLDLGYFRAGGEQYADEHNSFGSAPALRARHARQGGGRVRLSRQERGAAHTDDRRSRGGAVGSCPAASP